MKTSSNERWKKWKAGLSPEDWEKRKEQMRDKAREERFKGNKSYDWYERKPKKWIGWDGESRTDVKGEYWLLQNSEGLDVDADRLGRRYLTIHDMLPALTRVSYSGFDVVNVIYAGNFDFNMLFRHEPKNVRERIFQRGEVCPVDDEYEVRVIPRKMLKVRRILTEERVMKEGFKALRFPWKIYDVFGFFSATGSFLKTLEKFGIHPFKCKHDEDVCDDCIICQGKRCREDFPKGFDVKKYNKAEVQALTKLMDVFYSSLKAVDSIRGMPKLSRIRSFHGAGVLADRMLAEMEAADRKNCLFPWEKIEDGPSNDKIAEAIFNATGHRIEEFEGSGKNRYVWEYKNPKNRDGSPGKNHVADWYRRMTYFGGRNELLQRGMFEKVYNYDINSCYPTAIVNLPALDAVRWRTFTDFSEKDLFDYEQGICEVEWNGEPDDPMGPLPLRTDGKHGIAKGYVIFPSFNPSGKPFKGYYHLIEVQEAFRKANDTGLWSLRLTGKAFVVEPGFPKPFEKVRKVADKRLELKNLPKTDPMYGANEPLKLGLNSMYGKMAQRPMGRYLPKYRELFWAGYITAYGRSQLLKRCEPEDVILFATDGIYSTSKLDVPIGEGLGQWEFGGEGLGKFLLAGIYEFKGVPKHRGYPSLKFGEAFETIVRKAKDGMPEDRQTFTCVDKLFVGIKRSLRQKKQFPETKFYSNRRRRVNWNHNEKRWMWEWDGSRQTSYPSQSSQEFSSPYEAADFDEKERERLREAEDGQT